MADELLGDGVCHHFKCLFPRLPLGVLEGDVDDRILALFGAVRGVGPDLRPLEEVRV